jgi:hypothetical protein
MKTSYKNEIWIFKRFCPCQYGTTDYQNRFGAKFYQIIIVVNYS